MEVLFADAAIFASARRLFPKTAFRRMSLLKEAAMKIRKTETRTKAVTKIRMKKVMKIRTKVKTKTI
jgi:hypothetical protein|nr:MAG TPA: hypothetical protein [Caudoviricetes sp.]